MRDSWETTQSKLRKWLQSKSAWELRKILSESSFFRIIAMCAALRAPNKPSQVQWQDWWAFYLEQIPERQAIDLLLDVWNVDIWEHLQQESLATTKEILYKAQSEAQNIDFSGQLIEQIVLNSFVNNHNNAQQNSQNVEAPELGQNTQSLPNNITGNSKALPTPPDFDSSN